MEVPFARIRWYFPSSPGKEAAALAVCFLRIAREEGDGYHDERDPAVFAVCWHIPLREFAFLGLWTRLVRWLTNGMLAAVDQELSGIEWAGDEITAVKGPLQHPNF